MHFKLFMRFYTVTLNPQLTCQHIAEIQLQFYPLHAFLLAFFTQICDIRNTHIFCLIIIVIQGCFAVLNSTSCTYMRQFNSKIMLFQA